MSSVAAGNPQSVPAHPAALRRAQDQDASAVWIAPATLAMAGALLVAFIALFFRWFLVQNRHSMEAPDDWGHAYLVPLISGYVIWRRREAISRLKPEAFWPGLLPLLTGIVCYFFFVIGFPNHMLQGFAMVLTLAGLALLTLGPRVFPHIAFPIAYLGFGVTIAQMIMLNVTTRLQFWASDGATVLLKMIGSASGFIVEQAGNVINITTKGGETIPLNVAEACAGMRMVVAFYALGAAVAFLSCKHWWQRIALLLMAGPIAVFVNVLRVAFLGLASMFDADLAAGDAHMLIGVLWLLPAFLLFMGVVWALKRIVAEPSGTAPAGGKAVAS